MIKRTIMNTAMQPSLFTLSHSFLFAKNFVLPVMTLSFVPFKKKEMGKVLSQNVSTKLEASFCLKYPYMHGDFHK